MRALALSILALIASSGAVVAQLPTIQPPSSTPGPAPAPTLPSPPKALSPGGQLPEIGQLNPQSLDVVGVKLGMSFSEAERVIAENMTIGTKITFKPASDNGMVMVMSHGRIFVSDDRREYITLVHQPEFEKDKVLAVGRTYFAGTKSIDAADLLKAMGEKYGVRMKSELPNVGLVYQSGGMRPGARGSADPCFLDTGSRAGVVYIDDNGSPISWSSLRLPERAQFSGQYLPSISFKPQYLNDTSKFSHCLPHVSALLPDRTGMIDNFTIWITDPSGYMKQIDDGMRGSRGAGRPRL